MKPEQRTTLMGFIRSLADIPWFTHCGEPDTSVIVATDLVDAWDNWNAEMLAVWSPQTHDLERTAVAELGDSEVDAIFAAVSQIVDAPLREGVDLYFERRPNDLENAATNTDLSLWPEWVDSVKRDLCWAAVEVVLGRSGFFCELLRFYRVGRWACAWEGGDCSRRTVLL